MHCCYNFYVGAEIFIIFLFYSQSNGVRQAAQDGNLAHQTLDATSENNATSNHSSAYIAHLQKNKECSEKGSVAQVSVSNRLNKNHLMV